MRISPGSYFMKNGEQVVLGSPEPEDASRMLNFLRATAVESNFLVRYPEEITMTEADERSFIAGLDSSPNEFMLNARLGDQIIGNAAVNILAERQKLRHRASLGIAVRKDYWNLGLGRELLQRAIIHAGENGSNGFSAFGLSDQAPDPRHLRYIRSCMWWRIYDVPHRRRIIRICHVTPRRIPPGMHSLHPPRTPP